MLARKAAAAKRKAPSSAQSSPSTSSKKRTSEEKNSLKSVDGAAASSSLLQRWAAGVAAQLVSSAQLEHEDLPDGGEVEIDVEGAGRAAVDALPAGKLRTELRRDEKATTTALRLQVETRVKQQQQQSPKVNRIKKKKIAGSGSEESSTTLAAAAVAAIADAGAGGVVPCTVRLYRQARASAASGDMKLLKALAVNPRAPLDLLVDAVASAGGNSAETLETAVGGMRSLATALAADPRAAVCPSGVTFYAERAAAFASSAAAAVTKGDTAASKAALGAGVAGAEVCGLMLRILQIAGLAVNNTAAAATAAARGTDGDNDADGEGDGESSSAATPPADRLLLPCSPEASSSDVVLAAAEAAVASAPATTKPRPPPARLSVARLLAHYAVTAAVCSTRRCKGSEGGAAAAAAAAAAFIRSARAIATGRGAEGDRGSERNSSGGSSSDSSDDDDDDSSHSCSSMGLSQHLSTLCAAGLAGNEPATLEFLRCVGDAVCAVAPKNPVATSLVSAGDEATAVRASLAPVCSRALARLPRPAASPPPTAVRFLKRAYAFRVVGALNRSAAAASSPSSLSGRKMPVTALALSCGGGGGGGGGGACEEWSWDFVGAGTVSPPLLEFLERREAAAAVGKGPAGAAVEELAAARRQGGGRPAAVVELLKSSPTCAPPALSVLLSAMERLEGVRDSGEDEGGVGGVVGGKAEPAAMGGFFLDKGGAGGQGAVAGAGIVLARLGSGDGDVADMDEAEVASVVSSVVSDSDGEA
eukprot:g10660.t1